MIRLNHRDFDSWRKAYNTIEDLAAELTSADAWLDSLPEDDPARKPGKWFHVVSAMLNKKHQANLREQREARDAKPLGYYWDGVSP